MQPAAGMTALCLPYVSIRQHTSAYVSIRQHTSAYVSIRQHTSAYVSIRNGSTVPGAADLSSRLLNSAATSQTQCSRFARAPYTRCSCIRQHTSACVSIRQQCSRFARAPYTRCSCIRQHTPACVSIRQHTSAYVSIRQHTSACVSIRQHTSAYVCMRDSLALRRRGGVEERRLRVRICTFVLVKQVN
jgi:hypothetical protein